MKIIKKTHRHFKKLTLVLSAILFKRIHFFDETTYKNKKIIIIGPADTSLNYLPGADIDGFDIIIRINKSPLNLRGSEHLLGSRTDVLYHCFYENPVGGGGNIDLDLLTKQKNKYVIYPYAADHLEKNYYEILHKYKDKKFYRLKKTFYNKLAKSYAAKTPTTGLQALNHVMSCDYKELHITGFTFFLTGYASGYRDGYESASEGKQLAESAGNHNAEDELRLFIEIHSINKKMGKNIVLDSFLENIVLTRQPKPPLSF